MIFCNVFISIDFLNEAIMDVDTSDSDVSINVRHNTIHSNYMYVHYYDGWLCKPHTHFEAFLRFPTLMTNMLYRCYTLHTKVITWQADMAQDEKTLTWIIVSEFFLNHIGWIWAG